MTAVRRLQEGTPARVDSQPDGVPAGLRPFGGPA